NWRLLACFDSSRHLKECVFSTQFIDLENSPQHPRHLFWLLRIPNVTADVGRFVHALGHAPDGSGFGYDDDARLLEDSQVVVEAVGIHAQSLGEFLGRPSVAFAQQPENTKPEWMRYRITSLAHPGVFSKTPHLLSFHRRPSVVEYFHRSVDFPLDR